MAGRRGWQSRAGADTQSSAGLLTPCPTATGTILIIKFGAFIIIFPEIEPERTEHAYYCPFMYW